MLQKFHSNACVKSAGGIQIKTEQDVIGKSTIKEEEDVISKRSVQNGKLQIQTNEWQQEKKTLVQKIVSLKTENQKILLELRNEQSNHALVVSQNEELEKQVNGLLSKIATLTKRLSNVFADHADKNMQHENTIRDLSGENQLLLARIKQIQAGIDQRNQFNDEPKPTAISDDVFEVEKILGKEKRRGIWYYFIRWKGYGSDHDSWEKEKNLQCPEILKAFKKSVKKN